MGLHIIAKIVKLTTFPNRIPTSPYFHPIEIVIMMFIKPSVYADQVSPYSPYALMNKAIEGPVSIIYIWNSIKKTIWSGNT